MSVDILITGTGAFAGRMALDLASTTRDPITVMIAGRNSERLHWLRTACNARAKMFGTPASTSTYQIDLLDPDASERILDVAKARIVVQAASVQTSNVIADSSSQWAKLVAEGGLSATAVFQALISSRMAAAISNYSPTTSFINCCFPDVVNEMIVALGHKVLSGTGNVSILSNVFEGAKARASLGNDKLRVLAHYQSLAPWRRPAAQRDAAKPPRVFVGEQEIANVFATFPDVKLTREPAIEVSGASGVTLIQALAAGKPWSGHVPGPGGLPGGYPVRLGESGDLTLDLPAVLPRQDAIEWNSKHEEETGLTMQGRTAVFHGRLAQLLTTAGFDKSRGFDVVELEDVYQELHQLRSRLDNGLRRKLV